MSNPIFQQCFSSVVGVEGGYTTDPNDRGNWTSGICGVGECRGTKYGISAMSYPKEDIANLTMENAQAIYLTDYWSRIKGDMLPGQLALLVFDSAVNNGVGNAIKFLQRAIGATADGAFGPETMNALNKALQKPLWELCVAFMTERIVFMSGLPTWATYGRGWARRLVTTIYNSLTVGVSANG